MESTSDEEIIPAEFSGLWKSFSKFKSLGLKNEEYKEEIHSKNGFRTFVNITGIKRYSALFVNFTLILKVISVLNPGADIQQPGNDSVLPPPDSLETSTNRLHIYLCLSLLLIKNKTHIIRGPGFMFHQTILVHILSVDSGKLLWISHLRFGVEVQKLLQQEQEKESYSAKLLLLFHLFMSVSRTMDTHAKKKISFPI